MKTFNSFFQIIACLPFFCASAFAALPEPVQLTSGWMLQDAAKITQNAEAISSADFQTAGWHRATVPGTVLTSLVNDGVYPEPLYGENNRTNVIPDTLCRTTWWYRTPLVPPASFAGKRIWLNFDGINYAAEIWINGKQIGTIKGAFARGIFDVTSDVVVGATNILAVHIIPQPHPGKSHEKTIATGTGPNGGITAMDGPTFLCTIGWDWIPTIRDRDSGIWRKVTLSASGPIVLENPHVVSTLPLPRTDSADVTVQATAHNATDKSQTGVVSGAIGKIHFKQNISLAPHETRTLTFNPANTPSLHFKNPRLWWPNGYGPQNLYTLNLSVMSDKKLSDSRKLDFGIRQITYELPGSPNLALSVNGVPVVAKGGDWGMDEAMKRIPRSRLEAQIRMHQLANYTIIRNWVGQSTSEDFYDLCDRYGILVWDEFFQPNPSDGPNPDDTELYLANVREKILRFRNHPCIALWCGRNEGNPPQAISDGIGKLVAEFDSGRLYQPSSTSGRGVISWGPYHWRTPREFYNFGDFEAFKTEIGLMSVPTLEAIHAMMPEKDWNVINDDWAEHDFCAGAQDGNHYPEIIGNRYGAFSSLADFVRKSQLANYESYRALYEGRFAKLFHPVTAIITWMSNPAQPSFVWQLYSHDLEPNAALFAVRKACEPIHVMMNQTNWHVMIVNNTTNPLENLAVKTAIYNLDGSLQFAETNSITAANSAVTDAGAISFPDHLSAVHFVKLELRDARKKLLSENFYWRADPEHQDDFQALNALPMVSLDARAKKHTSRGRCILEVTLRNTSKTPALMAHLQLRRANSGGRVLPVFYSDNYISLLPGESKSLTIDAASADLHGEKPLLVVDGWNVTVKSESSGSVEIALNKDAFVRSGTLPKRSELGNISINCGGGRPGFFRFGDTSPGFVGDQDFKGGNTETSRNTIDVNAPNAAPAEVYQTERWGDCAYTIPVGKNPRTVRLHFAETKFGPGERKFNVDINGRRVLTDFDIAGETGKNKAVVKEFKSIAPNADGNIVVTLSRGSADQPKICGIEILK
jgi:hypothetical protein